MDNKDRNNKLSFCGIMTAVSAVLSLLMNILPFNTAFLLILMSLVMCIVTERAGVLMAFCTSLAVSAIMLLITWKYDSLAEYILLFGTYPIVKYLFESKIKNIKTERIVKTIYFAIISGVFMAASIIFFGGAEFWGEWFSKSSVIPYAVVAVMIAVVWIYDYVLTQLICFYNKKFSGRFRI